ncbi:single-stranded DNA-binding protein [Candidatus Cyanaurora vandensis]|uniref:single-stranded DNA-binding protein n=1 Tax=Candidatus Cyanaurora vandensis TaxID=2714958 RepID=UPI00257D7CC9|nr:single-stranded DNA-binding protein [Candidatus Cyanaurora vandensis]
MNSIVLMGEVANRPELRETQEGLARTNFILRYPSTKPDEPEFQVQVVAFGNSATEVGELVQGDQVTLEGRIQMNSFTRPDGTREKRAEVIIRRCHVLHKAGGVPLSPPANLPPSVPPPPRAMTTPTRTVPSRPPATTARPLGDLPPQNEDIPF